MTSLGNLQFVIHNSRSSKSTRRRLGACFLLAVQHVNSNDGAWGLSCEYPQDLRVPGWEVLRECRAVSHRSAGDLSAWVDSLTGKPTGPPGLRAWCNDTTIREANRTGSRSPPVTTMAGMLTEQLAANREQLELLERGPGTPTRRYDVAVTRCNSTPGGRDGLNDYSTSSRSALCRSSEIGLHGGSLSSFTLETPGTRCSVDRIRDRTGPLRRPCVTALGLYAQRLPGGPDTDRHVSAWAVTALIRKATLALASAIHSKVKSSLIMRLSCGNTLKSPWGARTFWVRATESVSAAQQ